MTARQMTAVSGPFASKLLALALCLTPFLAEAQVPQAIPVTLLAQAPVVDGKLTEWGSGGWITVAVKPALDAAARAEHGLGADDDKNRTGKLNVQIKAGVSGGRVFVALKYPDSAADTAHRVWQWRNDKYQEGKEREDMLALRFHMTGDFDRSMLSSKTYTADVWLWSAARTNSGGIADDFMHTMTTAMLDNAAEYALPGGATVYIRKQRDAGSAPFKALPKPKENKGEKAPSFELTKATGSAADVAAKGDWAAGHWNLEFSRALNTGHADDVTFKPGQKVLGQIAVFNQGFSEHKSVSEPLLFDFSTVK